MINFENLDKAIFPGVGKYGIPELCHELQKSGRKKFAFFCG